MTKKIKGRIIISRDRVELSERVAITIVSHVIGNPEACISVCVGATPSLSYRQISSYSSRGVVDFSRTKLVLWDEFLSTNPAVAPNPHYSELEKTLFTPAMIPKQRITALSTGMPIQQIFSAYQEIVNVRKVNLVILGLAPNGNLGWITPLSPVDQGVHLIDISNATADQNLNYSHCISLGKKQILEADEVILIAQARNKANIVAEIVKDELQQTPASWLLRNHNNVKFFIDSKAAAGLSQKITKQPQFYKGFRIIDDTNFITGKKIICFSPHPDDTSISAGATLAFFSSNNTVVSCCATTGHRAFIPDTTRDQRIAIREDEASLEAKHIGAVAHFLRLPLYERGSVTTEDDVGIVVEYLKTQNPDVIFIPHTGDTHPTHSAVVQAILQAICLILSNSSKQFEVYMYEGPWSIFNRGNYNTIVSVSPDFYAKKLAAIRAHVSQTDRTPYDVAGDSLSQLRGALVPEQDLSGFGGEPPKLQPKLELFFHVLINSTAVAQQLISLVLEKKPPHSDILRLSKN